MVRRRCSTVGGGQGGGRGEEEGRIGVEEGRGGKEEEKRTLEEYEEQESERKLDISKNY